MSAPIAETVQGGEEPNIREMRPADFQEMLMIENRAYDFPWSRNVLMSCLNGGYQSRVIEWRRRIVGYGVMLIAAAECHLVNLCIDPMFQQRGFGRKLLRLMLCDAVLCGAKRAFLEVRPSNRAALALYGSEHFNEVSLRKNYYPTATGREDALILTRLL